MTGQKAQPQLEKNGTFNAFQWLASHPPWLPGTPTVWPWVLASFREHTEDKAKQPLTKEDRPGCCMNDGQVPICLRFMKDDILCRKCTYVCNPKWQLRDMLIFVTKRGSTATCAGKQTHLMEFQRISNNSSLSEKMTALLGCSAILMIIIPKEFWGRPLWMLLKVSNWCITYFGSAAAWLVKLMYFSAC